MENFWSNASEMLWAGSVEMIRTLSRPLDSWTARLQLGKGKFKRQRVRGQVLFPKSSWRDVGPRSRGSESAENLRVWVIMESNLNACIETLSDLTY